MSGKNSRNQKFQRLYTIHSDKIYRLCYGYMKNNRDVEDLFQQVLLNIWRNLESFREESQLSTWIYRITVNTAITYSKKQKRQNKMLFSHADFSGIGNEEDQQHQRDPLPELRMLHKCIYQLEKQDRIIISLYLEDLSYEEIAEVVGISSNYVGVKINRIKKKLQQLMFDQ